MRGIQSATNSFDSLEAGLCAVANRHKREMLPHRGPAYARYPIGNNN